MTYATTLLSHDANKKAEVRLPFVPVAGMLLMAPFERNDYRKVHEVYWDHVKEQFEVYFEKAWEDE